MGKSKEENPLSLLIVDDDPKYLVLLKTVLSKEGYLIECTSSGESALSMVKSFRPDLILLDVVMPEMDGFEVCKRLRRSAKTRDIPVIFLTSQDSPEDTIKGFEIGAVDYITKPIHSPELLVRLRTHLELKRKRDDILAINRQLKKEMKAREKAESAFRESNEKFRVISEKSFLGIYIWKEGHFDYVNPAFAAIFDYNPKEITGEKLEKIIHPKDFAVFNKKLISLLKGELSLTHHQYRGITKDNDIKYLEDYKTRIVLRGETVVIGTIIDITHKKRMEEALAEKNKQLRQINKTLEKRIAQEVARRRKQEQFLVQQSKLASMGQMMGAIAHQWRQPLTTVGFTIENILDDIENASLDVTSMEESLNKAAYQIKQMSQTIDNFRNFFTPSEEMKDYDIIKTVTETLSIVNPELENKRIKSILRHSEDSLLTHGFSNEFKQVLINLINNGKDAVFEKRKQEQTPDLEGEIIISIALENGRAKIAIKDNGNGIPEQTRERVFEPYFSTKEHGLGIGLYMSKVIVEEHMKGKLYVGEDEHVGTGTEFILELPCLNE
jgi:PAS domain S-box-containing protein